MFQLGNIVAGVFTPVLAEHTKNLSLVDVLSVGMDRMQRNFEPMRKQVEAWKGTHLLDDTVKLVTRRVFQPSVEEVAPQTPWSLSNAFTSAFKDVDAIPQFKATAKLASFLELATTGLN